MVDFSKARGGERFRRISDAHWKDVELGDIFRFRDKATSQLISERTGREVGTANPGAWERVETKEEELMMEYKVGDKLQFIKETGNFGGVNFTKGDVYEVISVKGDRVGAPVGLSYDSSTGIMAGGFTMFNFEVKQGFRKVEESSHLSELRAALKKAEDAVSDIAALIAKEAAKEAQGRAKVVNDAREDVRNLESDMYLRGVGKVKPEYHVNQDKKTVVVRLHGLFAGKDFAKAKARASKEDAFSEAIGKAIALRRALGLRVPTKYLNAPQK